MTDMEKAIAAAVKAALNGVAPAPARKGRGKTKKFGGKLSDEQKAINAKANAAEAVALFEKAGFKNCIAHETIKTYGNAEKKTGWLGAGRKVKQGEKAIRTSKGMPLFHVDQTEPLVTESKPVVEPVAPPSVFHFNQVPR